MTTLSQIRETAYDMKPDDAVEYLLGVIEQTVPAFADNSHPVDSWGVHLPRNERAIAALLYDRSPVVVGRDALFDLIYSTRPDGNIPGPKILGTLICKLRKKIPPSRGKIITHHCRGYSFHKWDRERGYV